MKGRITMGIGRRPLGRLRRLTPGEHTQSKGVLANRSGPSYRLLGFFLTNLEEKDVHFQWVGSKLVCVLV